MRKTLAVSLVAAAALVPTGSAIAQGTVIVPGPTDAVTNVATRGAEWLNIGIGARQQGMGTAAIASSDGPSALFWNPANITAREGISAFATHMRLYGNSGISLIAGALTIPIGAGAAGIGVQQFSSGEMERTTERAPFGGDPVAGGDFSYNGIAVTAQYARAITDRFTAAFGLRFAQEGIDVARNSFTGVDLSTRFRTGLYGLTVGGTVQNIGTTGRMGGAGVQRSIRVARDNGNATGNDIPVQFNTREVDMPTVFRLGIQSALLGDAESLFGQSERHALIAEAAFSDAIDGSTKPALGVEYSFRQFASVRAGKRWLNEQNAPWTFADGLAFGGGVRLPVRGKRINLDYAFVNMGELQNNQIISLDVTF
jgi:hypothetical protein